MISKIEQKRLKEIIGQHYTSKVQKILLDRKILNKFGREHTPTYIRMVFQGFRKNSDIEKAIFDLAVLMEKEAKTLQLRKEKLFKGQS